MSDRVQRQFEAVGSGIRVMRVPHLDDFGRRQEVRNSVLPSRDVRAQPSKGRGACLFATRRIGSLNSGQISFREAFRELS